MRVAYVCTDPGVPVFGAKGASIHVQGVLGALLRARADVELFAARTGGDAPPGVVAHDLGRPAAGDAARRERALATRNGALHEALVAAGPFDLVYERHALFAWAAMRYARGAGVPGVLEVNAPLVEEQAAHRSLVDRAGAEQARRRALAAAGAVVAVSAALGRWLDDRPEAQGKVHVIPNGVDPSRFPAPRRVAGERPFTVVFVGSLKPWHGLETLVDAFALLSRAVPEARLLVVGDGPGRAGLEQRLRRAGVAHAATCTGAVPPALVGGLLGQADAAVAPYPPTAEDYFSPLKVFEGMAAGLPVVASCVGQLAELVRDGTTGILVPPGDARAIARALTALAADPARRARIGDAARDWVLREHTWDHVVGRVLGLARTPAAAAA